MQNGKKPKTGNNCLDVYVLLTITKSNLPVGSKMVMKKYAVIRNFFYIHGISATRKFLSDILHTCGDLRLY
jgi:hypothetical protein